MAIFIIGFVILFIIAIFKGCTSIDGTQMHQLQTFVCLAGAFLCMGVGIIYGELNDITKLLKKIIEKIDFTTKIKPDELKKLKQLAGEDAVNFASEMEDEWICVCGTKNPLNKYKKTQNCSKCNRDRDHVLSNYVKEKFNSKINE